MDYDKNDAPEYLGQDQEQFATDHPDLAEHQVADASILYRSHSTKKRDPKNKLIRQTVFVLNIIYLFVGLGILAIAVWTVVDRMLVVDILGSALYHVAVALFFIAGFVIIVVSVLGCLGAAKESKKLLLIYLVIVFLTLLLLFFTIVFAFGFRGLLGDFFYDKMKESLVNKYGYETERYYENQLITNSWDFMQWRFNCCAVDRYGWTLYQQSNWFKRQIDDRLRGFEREYVPSSCCVHDYQYWSFIIDRERCQNLMSAPPNVRSGAFNHYVYYKGCWEQGKLYLTNHSYIIFAIALVAILMLVAGFITAFIFWRRLREDKPRIDYVDPPPMQEGMEGEYIPEDLPKQYQEGQIAYDEGQGYYQQRE